MPYDPDSGLARSEAGPAGLTILCFGFQPQNALLALLDFDDSFLDAVAPVKRSRHDERLSNSVSKVGEKIDSFKERLAQIDEDNRLALSILDKLIVNDKPAEQAIEPYDNVLEQAKYYCNYCDMSFTNGISLCAHMMERHVTSNKKDYYCFACGKGHHDLDLLQRHISEHCQSDSCPACQSNGKKSHSPEEVTCLKLACDFCSYTDTRISSYQIHCLVCTNNPANENYQPTNEGRVCPKCSQVFHSNSHLQKHIGKKHGGESQAEIVCKFACEECGRRFPTSASLGGHKRVHRNKPEQVSKISILKPEDRVELVARSVDKMNGSDDLKKTKLRSPPRVEEPEEPVENMPDLL